MGVAIPGGGFSEDRASGAQIVDGGLRFDSAKSQYLKWVPSSAGNRTTWTWSGWIKRSKLGGTQRFFTGANATADNDWTALHFNTSDNLVIGAYNVLLRTSNSVYRDVNSWMHVVVIADLNNASNSLKYRSWVNNQEVTWTSTSTNQTTSGINAANNHAIGAEQSPNNGGVGSYCDIQLTNVYLIDGQALDPSYFGYTDPLTNVWRPKKLSSSVAFGTNGFYLPFDGSAPIGQDQSGRGNNWTPVNFGGSNTIEKATGALPILNTDGGGKVARPGTRTDENASDIVLALPLVGNKEDVSAIVKGSGSNKTVTSVNSVASNAQSNFYGGSYYFDGTGDYLTAGTSSDYTFGTGDFTVECWVYFNASGTYQDIFSTADYNSTNLSLRRTDGNALQYYINDAGAGVGSGGSMLAGKWYHTAITRNSGTLRLFVDGVVVYSATETFNFSTSGTFTIGRVPGNPIDLNGYIQDFRIYKGVAKYTSNFIPASTDPDVVPDSPSGVSYSSNVALVPSTDGAVAFDGSGDYLTLADSTDFNFGNGDFTIEGFAYVSSVNSYMTFGPTNFASAGTFDYIVYDSGSRRISFAWYPYNTGGAFITSSNTYPLNSWFHWAVTRSGNTFRIFINGNLEASGTNSTALSHAANTVYIGRTDGLTARDFNGFQSNIHVVKGTALYTSNFTPPSAPISSVANTKLLCCKSNSSAIAFDVAPTSGINNGRVWSANVSASTGSIVDASLAFNGSTSSGDAYASSTASDTYIYIDFSPSLSGAFKLWTGMSSGTRTATVTHSGGSSVVNLSSGENSLGTFTSVTRIAVNRGEAATHSFRAISVDDVVLTDPVTVNGNTAATNFNPFTANINTQRGKQSGYATLNPLAATTGTFSNGNLQLATVLSGYPIYTATQYTPAGIGKWYWEFTLNAQTGTNYTMLGMLPSNSTYKIGQDGTPYSFGGLATYIGYNGVNSAASGAATASGTATATITVGDTVGWAFDAENGTVVIYKNGISQGTCYTNVLTNIGWTFAFSDYDNASSSTINVNFGQKPFKFPPPAGFQPLTLANTPRPTIVRPDQYVGVSTWSGAQSGSGGLTRQISTGFQPDFVWIKQRNQSFSTGHQLYDSVRGAGAEKELNSSGTAAEGAGNIETYGWLNSFDKTGFTVKGGSTDYDYVDKSGTNYVAWAWKAGGNSNTYNINDIGYSTASAAGLTAGTITPSGASVNTKSGFSIIRLTTSASSGTYTVSHGLGKDPAFFITKRLNSTSQWWTYHKSIGQSGYLNLASTAASATDYAWGANPTSSVITYTNDFLVGSSDYIIYAWAEIPGFSKFGSYTGNGSTDGPVIITGFRPRWIMIKRTDSTSYWHIYDTSRNTYNVANTNLWANGNDAEISDSAYNFDIVSNGFKVRTSDAARNASGGTYIYACWAETPSFNLYGAMSNAR